MTSAGMKSPCSARVRVGRLLATALVALSLSACAQMERRVPMHDKGAATYYVAGSIEGVGDVEFMVDTGAGYMTINEYTLEQLKKTSSVEYVKQLSGIMADGSRTVIPVYRIGTINIGGVCKLHNVEAAVFPQKTRMLLGLSALKHAAPFTFSTNPPQLVLSNCTAS